MDNRIAKRHVFLGACFMIWGSQAFCDTPARLRDFTKVTENGVYILVMLAPKDKAGPEPVLNPQIRTKYRHSGLYRNDGSSQPLWTVDWYATEVFPSSDGAHLVRMGPWPTSFDDVAVAFYRHGKEIKTYKIKDLLKDPSKVVRTASHFFWRSEVKFYDQKSELSIKTLDGGSFRFSVHTGEILESRPKDLRTKKALTTHRRLCLNQNNLVGGWYNW